MKKEDVIAGYMMNEKHVIAEMLYDTITKYEEAKMRQEIAYYKSLGACIKVFEADEFPSDK